MRLFQHLVHLSIAFVVAVLFAVEGSCALASGDLVYLARYYYPPGGHRISTEHIYTIDATGRNRRQLTFGDNDNSTTVKWSPNGKLILYTRWVDQNNFPFQVWTMDDRGHHHREIIRLKIPLQSANTSWLGGSDRVVVSINDAQGGSITDNVYDLSGKRLSSTRHRARNDDEGNVVFSPDHTQGYNRINGSIIDIRSGKILGITKTTYNAVTWVEKNTIVGIGATELQDCQELAQFDISGKIVRKEVFTNISTTLSDGWDVDDRDFWSGIEQVPGHEENYLARQYLHPHRDFILFWFNFAHNQRFFAECNPCTWSPDKRRLCGILGTMPAKYQLRSDGTWRMVWVAPLEVFDVPSGTVHIIQGGLVDVEAADWRGGRAANRDE